jgi:N-methylhydantoinase B
MATSATNRAGKRRRDEYNWDGVRLPYIPGDQLEIAPSLHLHADSNSDIDPVTYEVIRHSLWQANQEHGVTIARMSGSPITKYTMDFNPAILTQDAQFVFFGPYLQWFAGMIDIAVKWTLENRSENPGINDGDMFLMNDPWVGTTHQQDVGILCPVFHDGKLYCWVTNAAHQYDVGGITPGSFCPSATSVFDEPTPLPPVKIVEGGRVRRDVEELYLRHSRAPYLVGLDLRAQIAGNAAARDRILRLVDRYGAATVKGVMLRIIDNGEEGFVHKLAAIPDGEWREEAFLDVKTEGDRGTYKIAMTLRKERDRLTFSNEGSEPEAGLLGASFAAWKGGILTVVNAFLCYEQLYALGGASRHIEFDPTPGTLSCATYPSPMSCGGTIGAYGALILANNTVAKMMAGSPQLRSDLMGNEANSQWPIVSISGTDQRGEPFGTAVLDPMAGGLGALSYRDGVDTGGLYLIPRGMSADVEQNEQTFPILYLYRKELPDSGGAGKYRGGNSATLCFIRHKTDDLVQSTATSGVGTPTSIGLFGAYPGCTNMHLLMRGTDVHERFRSSDMPADIRELKGDLRMLPPKLAAIAQEADDVYESWWSGASGYGDPLERDPAAVRADVLDGAVTEQTAREIYGVGASDAETEQLRRERRERRRRGRAPAAKPRVAQGDVVGGVGEAIELVAERDGVVTACARCHTVLGVPTAPIEDGCHVYDMPVEESNRLIADPRLFVDETMVHRQYCCPGCLTLISGQVTRAGEPTKSTIGVLDPQAVQRMANGDRDH